LKAVLKIKQYRVMRDLSTTELARKVNVAQGYISDIENGNKFPSIPLLCHIAKALSCKPGELIECEE